MLSFSSRCLAVCRPRRRFNIFFTIILPTLLSVRTAFICCQLLAALFSPLSGQCSEKSNYQVKAAFIYQFINFTEWPAPASAADDNTITIGIIGPDPFDGFFKPVEGSEIGGRILVIRRFPADTPLKKLEKCWLLFISKELDGKKRSRIIHYLADFAVLTVGESDDFITQGGMIRLFLKNNKVKFIVNRGAAARVGISFRARLLRVADQVIEEIHE